MFHPYQPSGKSGVLPVLLLATLSIVVGIVASLLLAAITMFLHISLFIVFPAALGFAVGGIAILIVKSGKIRAPLLAGALALIGALVGQGMTHVIDYGLFAVGAAREKIEAGASREEAWAAVDAKLQGETGQTGFIGFLAAAAQEGVTLRRGGGSKGIQLTGVGAWLLWLAELALAGGVAYSMARGRARKPFCEGCQVWYAAPSVIGTGDGVKSNAQAIKAGLENSDWAQVRQRMPGTSPSPRFAELTIAHCPQCYQASEPAISLHTHLGSPAGKRKNSAEILHGLLGVDDGKQLEAALTATEPSAGGRDPFATKF